MEFIKLILSLSNDYLLMFISVLFFIFSKKHNHFYLILLLLFSMIYKTILKDIFKWPVPITSPTLNFAFPSGHMNFATIFYLWFMITYKSKALYIICPAILILSGWAMVFAGYHSSKDVFLTPIFAITLLIIYKVFIEKLPINKSVLIFILIAFISQLISIILFDKIKCDAIIGIYGILGFAFGFFIRTKQYRNAIIPLIFVVFSALLSDSLKIFMENIMWFVIFFIVIMDKQPRVED